MKRAGTMEAPAPALPELAPGASVLRLYNKSDALDAASLRREREDPARRPEHARDALWISARSGLGLDALRARLREIAVVGQSLAVFAEDFVILWGLDGGGLHHRERFLVAGLGA